MSYHFFPTMCITTVGEMQTAQPRSCLYLPAQTTGPQLPSFCPSTTLSLASAPHPQYRKALSVAPVKAPKFPKKLPENHNYPTAISILSFPRLQELPVHGVIHRISHTGREHLEPPGHVFFRTFLLLLLPCPQPCMKHMQRHRGKVLACIAQAQGTYIWYRSGRIQWDSGVKKTHGIEAAKGSFHSEAVIVPIILVVGEHNFLLSSEWWSLHCPYHITRLLHVCQQIAKGWYFTALQ